MSNPLNLYTGQRITDVINSIAGDIKELRLFKEFVLQDPKMLEKFEAFKTFKRLKDQ